MAQTSGVTEVAFANLGFQDRAYAHVRHWAVDFFDVLKYYEGIFFFIHFKQSVVQKHRMIAGRGNEKLGFFAFICLCSLCLFILQRRHGGVVFEYPTKVRDTAETATFADLAYSKIFF